ncbi:hypothetical protein D3C80_559880 [compost metagenome]
MCAALSQNLGGGGVVNIDQWANHVRLASQQAQCRQVVGFDRKKRLFGGLPDMLCFAFKHDECKRAEADCLACLFQTLDHICHVGIDEMESFGANDFTERDVIDRSFIGNAEIEIAPFRTVPEKENRPEAKAGITA